MGRGWAGILSIRLAHKGAMPNVQSKLCKFCGRDFDDDVVKRSRDQAADCKDCYNMMRTGIKGTSVERIVGELTTGSGRPGGHRPQKLMKLAGVRVGWWPRAAGPGPRPRFPGPAPPSHPTHK